MALRDEIPPFTDGNGLVTPGLATPGVLAGSDNGPMYTSEYYVMLQKLGQLQSDDYAKFDNLIQNCINSEGMLCRVPVGQDDGQEQVDDYYGVLNGCMQMGNTVIPRQFLAALIKNLGFMDNVNPGSHKNWASFMPRQMQLMACVIAGSFPGSNPLNLGLRALFCPLFAFSAIILATSCIGVDPGDTDARRLSWHLYQCLKDQSLLCRLAGKIWLKRLYKDYGPTGMQAVAKIYYQGNHPFKSYWVTE